MKNITYLLLSLLFLSSTPKNHIKPIDEIIIGSWRIDSYELDYINKPSEIKKNYEDQEFRDVRYSIKGEIKFSTLELKNKDSDFKVDSTMNGRWVVYKKNTLIEYVIQKYSNVIWTSEITLIDNNTIKKVINFEDSGVLMDDKNIIGETLILKRID